MAIAEFNLLKVSVTATKEVVSAIKAAVSVVPNRAHNAALKHVAVSFKRYAMTLAAMDSDTYYLNTVSLYDTDVTQYFTVLVPVEALKTVKARSTLSFSPSHVTINGVTFNCPMESSDFPQFPQLKSDYARVDVTQQYFNEVSTAAVSAATSELRPILTGVHHANNTVTTTDGLRLYRGNVGTTFEQSFVLPASAVKLLSKTFADGATLLYDGQLAQYHRDGATVIVRLLDGTYPDTSRIIPNSFKTEITLNSGQLLAMCQTVTQMHKTSKTNGDYATRIDVQNGVCTVSAKCGDAVFDDTLQATVTGEPLTIACNATYLVDALKQLDSDTVMLRFNAANSPFTLSADGKDVLVLVSPVLLR